MAAHNAETWIGEAIASCLAQTTPPLEVIVVDDASNDRTTEIVREIGDERVRLEVLPENVGPGPARNVALELARGDWLSMMDADDVMVPTRLEVLQTCAAEHPDLSIFSDFPSRKWDHADLQYSSSPRSERPEIEVISPADLLRRNLGAKPFFSSDILQSTGVRYPAFRAAQDTSFLVQLASAAGLPIGFVRSKTYLYRDVPGSLSKRSEGMIDERLRMLDDLETKLIHDDDVIDAIAVARRTFLDDRAMFRLKRAVDARSPRAVADSLSSSSTWRAAARRLAIKLRSKPRTDRPA